jgi:membrane protease YdiL (CAAX protease family)
MRSLWNRLPVVLRAAFVGLIVGTVVTVPWAVFVWATYTYWPTMPWALPPTILLLWLWWQYVSGRGWPQSTARSRRTNLRANRLPEEVWIAALVAGVLGLATCVLILNVTNRLVTVPEEVLPNRAQIPLLTLLCLHVTGSVLAGIVEEAAFRGYMQRPMEQRHGPVVAILVTGSWFGIAHFTHPGVLVMMPFYLAVGATYGALAYFTDSIFPSMVLHSVGNILDGLPLVLNRTAPPSVPTPLIWETGADASFWLLCATVAVVAAATVWAYAALAVVVRKVVPETAASI